MGYRGISGIIRTPEDQVSKGSVTIRFATADLAPGTNAQFDDVAVFGKGIFLSKPCKMVSLRRIGIQDSDAPGGFPVSYDRTHMDTIDLSDEFVTDGNEFYGLKISWNASPSGLTMIHEISVLVIGETED